MSGTITLEMTDGMGLTYVDTLAVTFHASFFRALKWLVALPAAGLAAAVYSLCGGDVGHLLPE